jgi:hypothetical protein
MLVHLLHDHSSRGLHSTHLRRIYNCVQRLILCVCSRFAGGFASDSWRVATAYYGTGETFLWRSHPHPFGKYEWSGNNNYIMHSTESSIAFGGG